MSVCRSTLRRGGALTRPSLVRSFGIGADASIPADNPSPAGRPDPAPFINVGEAAGRLRRDNQPMADYLIGAVAALIVVGTLAAFNFGGVVAGVTVIALLIVGAVVVRMAKRDTSRTS